MIYNVMLVIFAFTKRVIKKYIKLNLFNLVYNVIGQNGVTMLKMISPGKLY